MYMYMSVSPCVSYGNICFFNNIFKLSFSWNVRIYFSPQRREGDIVASINLFQQKSCRKKAIKINRCTFMNSLRGRFVTKYFWIECWYHILVQMTRILLKLIPGRYFFNGLLDYSHFSRTLLLWYCRMLSSYFQSFFHDSWVCLSIKRPQT